MFHQPSNIVASVVQGAFIKRVCDRVVQSNGESAFVYRGNCFRGSLEKKKKNVIFNEDLQQ